MGSYDFEALSPIDFEDLSCDLVGAELHVSVESFTPGRDGGVDGRFEWGGGKGLIQAKHMKNSTFPKLERSLRRSRTQIDQLAPSRYLVCTSQRLTPQNKDTLKALLEPHVLSTDDIWGKDDINARLRRFPEIEKSHHKLWLHSSGVLERLINNTTASRTDEVVEEIGRANQVFVAHPGYSQAQKIIDEQKVLIVAGPPGVGKTTLSLVVASRYLEDDWEILAVSSVGEALQTFQKPKKQVFVFDDFLGVIKFDQRALSNTESDFRRFMSMVRKNPGTKRFILTTRKYILAEARISSEALSDEVVKLSDVVIDLKMYSEEIKAKILYNHLYFSNLDQNYVVALVNSGRLLEIIKHKNYMPRLIEWLTDEHRLSGCSVDGYPAHFMETLAQPDKIWEHAVSQHLGPQARLLLFCFFISSPYSHTWKPIQDWFNVANFNLSQAQNYQISERDFEEALAVIEGSFVELGSWRWSFVNPSLQDFLNTKLKASPLLVAMAESVAEQEQGLRVWRFVKHEIDGSKDFSVKVYAALADATLKADSTTAKNVSVCQFIEYAHDVSDVLHRNDIVTDMIVEDVLSEQESELAEFPRMFEELEAGVYELLNSTWLRKYLSDRFVAALEDSEMDFDDLISFLGDVESAAPDFSLDELSAIEETVTSIVQGTELPPHDADEGDKLGTLLEEMDTIDRWSSSHTAHEFRHRIIQRCNDIDAERAWHEEQAMDEYYLQGPVKQPRPPASSAIVQSRTATGLAAPTNSRAVSFSDGAVNRMFSSLIEPSEEV